MTLHTDALGLLETLKSVVEALKQFEHRSGAPYAEDMAARLEPLVSDLEVAIVQNRSREQASDLLASISPLLHNINGAATKGDLAIFPNRNDQTLNRYWDLETIFRESKYANEKL